MAARYTVLIIIAFLISCSGPRERVVVLDAAPGEQLTVTTSKETVTLDKPSSTADIQPGGKVKFGTSTPEVLQARYEKVLETVPKAAVSFTLYFDTGKTAIKEEGYKTLEIILKEVERRSVAEIQVIGHTDQAGPEDLNDRLSLARADAVSAALLERGLEASFMRVIGKGEHEPLVNLPNHAEPKNRRVEIWVR